MSDKVIHKITNPQDSDKYTLVFTCPACQEFHQINQSWEFNGDYEKPSISPSIRVQGHRTREDGTSETFVCHTWITKGRVKFFDDCTHSMAGQRWIDLPSIDETKI